MDLGLSKSVYSQLVSQEIICPNRGLLHKGSLEANGTGQFVMKVVDAPIPKDQSGCGQYISIAYLVYNPAGQRCCDPEVQIGLDFQKSLVIPVLYKNDLLIHTDFAFNEDGTENTGSADSILQFLENWINELTDQGIIPITND